LIVLKLIISLEYSEHTKQLISHVRQVRHWMDRWM